MHDESFPRPSIEEGKRLRRRVANGEILVFDPIAITGDLPQALEEFEHAEVLAEGRDAPGLQAYALYSCGYACMEMGALPDAGARFASARRILGDAGDPRAPMLDALSD